MSESLSTVSGTLECHPYSLQECNRCLHITAFVTLSRSAGPDQQSARCAEIQSFRKGMCNVACANRSTWMLFFAHACSACESHLQTNAPLRRALAPSSHTLDGRVLRLQPTFVGNVPATATHVYAFEVRFSLAPDAVPQPIYIV